MSTLAESSALHGNAADKAALYDARLRRYLTAMHGGMPDMIPIRPFVAEFTGTYAGYDCQQLAHDYSMAFEAACRCAADFDWDAVVANMVYVWTGLTQAMGLKYYGVPGIDIPPTTGFQYREPPENNAFMRPDEYDALIEDPTGFLYNVWWPRVSRHGAAPGQPASMESTLALVKGGMAMWKYFCDFGPQIERLKNECGMPSAIAGIFKAPMDIIADKLRGYLGLVEDLFERRDKVVAACEALMPHLAQVARMSAGPGRQVPIGYWMHRGGVPFVSFDVFENIYWATTKPIIEQLWSEGYQTLFYAEGKWDHHLKSFATLPEGSIVYHVDQGDIYKTHEVLGEKFCISGGLSNVLLAFGSPDEVRAECKKIIDGVARDGRYIMDAGAIVQNDAKVENIRAMTDFTREYGVYSRGHSEPPPVPPKKIVPAAHDPRLHPREGQARRMPGVCQPWAEQRAAMGSIPGDEALCRRIWEEVDALGYVFIWQVLLSF